MYKIISIMFLLPFISFALDDTSLSWKTFYESSNQKIVQAKNDFTSIKKLALDFQKRIEHNISLLDKQNRELVLNNKDNSKVEELIFKFRSTKYGIQHVLEKAKPKMDCELFLHDISYYLNPSNNQVSPSSKLTLRLAKKFCPIN